VTKSASPPLDDTLKVRVTATPDFEATRSAAFKVKENDDTWEAIPKEQLSTTKRARSKQRR
jgi:hypothetical protein